MDQVWVSGSSRMKRHSQQPPSSPFRQACPICERQFDRAEHLKRHLATHTKERDRVCRVCGRKFSRKYMTHLTPPVIQILVTDRINIIIIGTHLTATKTFIDLMYHCEGSVPAPNVPPLESNAVVLRPVRDATRSRCLAYFLKPARLMLLLPRQRQIHPRKTFHM